MSENMKSRYRSDENAGIIIPKGPERAIPTVPVVNDEYHIPYGTELVTSDLDQQGNRIILSHEDYVAHMLARGVKLRLDVKRGEI